MITQTMLTDLKELLLGWNIKPDDWYITGEAAMVLSGYPVTFRNKQMDVLVCRSVWPWAKPEEEVSLFPPKGSKEDKELKIYISKHDMTPDFHPLPHVGIRAEDRFSHTYAYPKDTAVRILSPWAGIYHRKCIIEFYEKDSKTGLNAFDQNKFIRWKKFIQETQSFAQSQGDQMTVQTCVEVIPIVQRAIDFFNKVDSHDNSTVFLKGICAYNGKVRGEVKLWEENADFTNKIAVLKSALPHQFSKLSAAAGIITDEGGLLSHAAIIAREFKVPTVIGTNSATSKLRNGDIVEIEENVVKKI